MLRCMMSLPISISRLSALALCSFVSLTACGGSSDEETPDAGPDGGGNTPAAEMVACNASVTKEITTNNTTAAFIPASTTVTAGTTVRFVMSTMHDARSNQNLFTVNYGETVCVKFNTAGAYTFRCNPHGFSGTVTVQ